MTYRSPAFMVDNLLSAITDVANDVDEATNTSTLTNDERRKFIDGRQGVFGIYTATGVDAGVRVDTLAIPSPAANRLVIPSGHDFDTETFEVLHDDGLTLPSPTTASSAAVSGSGVIDRTLSSGNERYWGFQLSTSSARTYTCAGYWLGVYEQLSTAAAVQPGWQNGFVSQVIETEYPSGIAAVELAAPRRQFSLEVRDIDPSGSDYTILDSVLQARGRSFWYWPPDDTDEGPFLVRLASEPTRRQEFKAPQQGLRYKFAFDFVEDRL